MKKLTRLALCAVCATVGFNSLRGIEWGGENRDVFHQAVKALGGEGGTEENFSTIYWDLYARDPWMGLWIAVMHPWLIPRSGDIWNQVYRGADSGAQRNGVAPIRGGAVTNLTIISITVTTNAIKFHAKWPPGFPIPCGWLELRAKLDLADAEWDFIDCVIVDPEEEEVTFELPFEEDSILWHYMDAVFAKKAFFKLTVHDPGGWLWPEGGDSGEGDPPDFPPPTAPAQPQLVRLNGSWYDLSVSLSKAVPLVPGQQYLIHVVCYDYELWAGWNNGVLTRNLDFSWGIDIPGVEPLTGGTDSRTLCNIGGSYLGTSQVPDFWLVTVPTNAVRSDTVDSQISLAISNTSSSQPPTGHGTANSTGFSLVDIQFVPLVVQNNMPTNALPPNLGSTDFWGYVSTNLAATGGVAYITGEPHAPLLSASLYANIGTSNYDQLSYGWRLEIETERPAYRGTLDNRKYPADGTFYTSNPSSLGPYRFDITSNLMSNEVVGGKCTLHYTVAHVNGTAKTNKFEFYIRGMNPPDAAVTNYIHTLVSASPVLGASFSKIARSMVWIESKDTPIGIIPYVCNQYNVGTNKWLAFKGNNSYSNIITKVNGIVTTNRVIASTNWGWGICQVDWSGHNPPAHPPTAALYDWKMNCYFGVATMVEKRDEYLKFVRYFKNMYPKQFVNPPATITFNGVTMSPEHFGTMVLYNGARGCPEVWVKNDSGKLIKIKSPIHFDHQTKVWTVKDNGKGYAVKITNEMKNPTSARE